MKQAIRVQLVEHEKAEEQSWWDRQPLGFQPTLGLSGCIVVGPVKEWSIRGYHVLPNGRRLHWTGETLASERVKSTGNPALADCVVKNPLGDRTILTYPDWLERCNEEGLRHNCGPILPCGTAVHKSLEDTPGWVYFIQDLSNQNIKIGRSGRQPSTRLGELQTGCSGELRLLRQDFTQTMLADEEYLQKKFHTDWIRGEWFLPSRVLLDFIEGSHEEKENRS